MMKIFGAFLAIPLLLAVNFAQAQQVSDFKTAINTALKNGQSRSELNDPVAQVLRNQMRRPNARVILHVTTIGDLPQAGCKRLNLHFTSPGSALELVGGGTKDLDVSYGANMCQDGLAPIGDKNQPQLFMSGAQKP